MYKNILLGCRYSIKNEKALKEVSKLAGPDTVVTILNAIMNRMHKHQLKVRILMN